MIIAYRFAERKRGMTFAPANHAPFLGVIVARQLARAEPVLARGCFDGVRHLVTQSQRRRLRSASSGAQRAVRIPSLFGIDRYFRHR